MGTMTAPTLSASQPFVARPSAESNQRLPQSVSGMSPQLHENSVFQWFDTCAADLFGACNGTNVRVGHLPIRDEVLHSLDFAQLHDHFLESLLREAAEQKPTTGASSDSIYKDSSHGEGYDSDSSFMQSNSQTRKRRMPLRIRKQESLNVDENENPQPPAKPYDPTAPPPVSPEQFLHEHVRMQKDKGRGEEPGSLICAKGQAACLEKFRAKMRLLCTTAIQEKGASMKRRPARISLHLDNFAETRSILEVRLGFLSMMYGILLRWDTNVTGKISLVVLRKMCHESFYPHESPPPINAIESNGSSETGSETDEVIACALTKDRSAPRVVAGDAIVDWPDGTEVTILEPPYLIPRPEKFKPSQFSVSSLTAFGLDRKGTWTIQFSLDLEVVTVNLAYDQTVGHFVPRPPWTGTTYDLEALDTSLDVTLYQVRSRRRKCMGSMQVPISNLPLRKDPATHLSFPCQNARIEIDVYLESESLEWTQNELEARRKAANFFWPRTPRRSLVQAPPPPMLVDTDDEDDEDDAWGWILCHMC